MNHAKLLDCTLRDGAYLIDKKFGDATAKGIIKGLIDTGVELIEIGFLQDDGFGEGKVVFKNAAQAEKLIPENRKNSMFTVLADFSRYSIDNLDDFTGKSFDAVRACFFKKERYDVIEFCRKIKEKGYKLFVQPVDILGYTDSEMLEFIDMVNELEPYCFSIVDTFGSMYCDDLQRVYSLINHNLVPGCKIGFHSHNNMQMSSALSQEFLRMTYGSREVVVDATISGMGRGAGNTPTELIAQYMVTKLGYSYDIDALLDIIDEYMDNIRSRCSWGYDTHYFITGAYSAHVNNIFYLKKKNSIRYKDIRYILNKVGAIKRKRYDYDLLESTYLDYLNSEIDDSGSLIKLKKIFKDRNVVVIAPGGNAKLYADKINSYVHENDALVITVNFAYKDVKSDFVYFSNVKRYNYWSNMGLDIPKIITSNVTAEPTENETVVSFVNLVKCGWEHMDNSTILLLRLLDKLNVATVAIAGFDGYDYVTKSVQNYVSTELELSNLKEESIVLNREISEMLKDFMETKEGNEKVIFITPSKFESIKGDGND